MRPASGGTAAVSPSPLWMEGAYWCIADGTAQPSVAWGDSRAVGGPGPTSASVCAITMDCLRVRRGPRPAEVLHRAGDVEPILGIDQLIQLDVDNDGATLEGCAGNRRACAHGADRQGGGICRER